MLNTGMTRAVMQPLFHQGYLRLRASDTGLNIAIRQIAHPATQAKTIGLELCVVAKTDALHATTNAGQQTDAI